MEIAHCVTMVIGDPIALTIVNVQVMVGVVPWMRKMENVLFAMMVIMDLFAINNVHVQVMVGVVPWMLKMEIVLFVIMKVLVVLGPIVIKFVVAIRIMVFAEDLLGKMIVVWRVFIRKVGDPIAKVLDVLVSTEYALLDLMEMDCVLFVIQDFMDQAVISLALA